MKNGHLKRRIVFLSSLKNNRDYGGAFLRNEGVKFLYQNLGFDIDETFWGSEKTKYSFAKIYQIMKYSKIVRSFFKVNKTDIICNTDYIHLDNLKMFNWKLPTKPKIIYNAHNLETENYFGRIESAEAINFFNYELECIERTYLTFVCSERERKLILDKRPYLNKKVIVVPNLVNAESFEPSTDKNLISFIGTLSYFPNTEALEFIINNYFELSKAITPYKLVIAGKDAPENLQSKMRELGITYSKNLTSNELAQIYNQTKILIVPLLNGSGTRLKIIEAIFAGAYVLSTAKGKEGIDSSYITESTIEDFISNLKKLIESDLKINSNEINRFKDSYDKKTWCEKNLIQFEELFK